MMTGRRQTLPDVITALDIEATPPASRASNKSTDAPIAVAIQRKKSLPGNAAAVRIDITELVNSERALINVSVFVIRYLGGRSSARLGS